LSELQQEIKIESEIKQSFIEEILRYDDKDLEKIFEIISMMRRAFKGQQVKPDDPIRNLIDIKNILERSRFPSMAIINFQVYCRLLAKFHPELSAFKEWADTQARALIEYKGAGREEFVKLYSAQFTGGQGPQTQISFGQSSAVKQLEQQQQKKHWYSRKPKEEGEFKN